MAGHNGPVRFVGEKADRVDGYDFRVRKVGDQDRPLESLPGVVRTVEAHHDPAELRQRRSSGQRTPPDGVW